MHRYFVLYKPFGYLSQFTREVAEHKTLADLYSFPPDVYPVGRLDKDSEGLLLVTNDKSLNNKLLNPKFSHSRTYWVQVEGDVTPAALQQLREGVTIRLDKKDYQTRPAQVRKLTSPPVVPDRDPPIRFRKNIPESWIELILTEGKNRQVRRMCAAVGFPVLRLIRVKIEDLKLKPLEVGLVQEWKKEPLFKWLFPAK